MTAHLHQRNQMGPTGSPWKVIEAARMYPMEPSGPKLTQLNLMEHDKAQGIHIEPYVTQYHPMSTHCTISHPTSRKW